jgi:hypothetical protein
MEVLTALSNVRDEYVLESALPPVKTASPKVIPRSRRGGKDHSLGRAFSDGWVAAAVCTVVALGTLAGMVWLGQRPLTPPNSSDTPAITDEPPMTEGIHTASLTFISRGDGTCSVKASESFGQSGEDAHLVIPEASPDGDRVVAVEDYGFIWKTDLKSVSLPDTVTCIGQWAFAECSSLETVELPRSLTSIGTAAFLECTALREITLPEGLATLGDSAFSTCTALTRVVLPTTLKAIPQWCFYNCAALEELTFAEGLTEIGYSAFYGCTSMTTVTLPATLRTLSKGAFAACKRLLSVTCPEGLTAVQSLAFDQCASLATVTLPATLEALAADAFRDCTAMRTVVFTGTRAEWRALIGDTSPLPAGCNTHCADGVVKN